MATLLLLLWTAPPEISAADGVTILKQHCLRCHSAETTRGGLDLSTRRAALAGGATSDAIVPSNLEKSAAYQRAKDHSMPPPKDAPPLTDAEAATLGRWIELGAPWPAADQLENRLKDLTVCFAVDSKSRRVRTWRRHGNVAAPLPQVALCPARR